MPAELATSLASTEEDQLFQAEATVRDYCGWHIAPSREETVTFADPVGSRLMLPSLYVTAVSSVTVDGVTQDPSTYRIHRNGWIERRGSGAQWYGGEVSVTFTHGYATPPESVTAAVKAVAQNSIATTGGLTRKTVGPFTDVYALPADLLAGLGAYRIVQVA